MIVGIYSRKVSDINGMKFYLEQGTQEVGEALPSSIQFTDADGVAHTCLYDQAFSKEVGHHAYAYDKKPKMAHRPAPTPIVFDTPSNEGDIKNDGGEAR